MKRFFLAGWLLIALLLSGCGSSAPRVETLNNWSFQYNEGTDDYSVFFGLADKNDNPVSADVNVDIRIVNDENEAIYTGTKAVTSDDYSYYTSQAVSRQRKDSRRRTHFRKILQRNGLSESLQGK